MDVRQLAFLAGQPSAAVIPRERFMGMPKRGLAFLLANVMFWQPMWAQADGIVVSAPGTGLDRAGNGVPIVNIATPNATGLSHNQFHDYNVTLQGLILNNGSTQTSATQLGGFIVGNPNLKNSGSAQTILNEVNGGSPSQLNGYTEVAGQSARVIVANPYGISCNGCGFINTPRVTLTTGKPVLDNGRLDRFQVDQGSVSIDGAGLNATNVDRFEIITRSAKINAQIQANNLTIVAGRNDVNADTLNATARANDGSAKPELAIDSSALGGMYAGAIKLVGTEAGVGVKLDGKLIASGGDIQLDANGHLSLADTSAVNGAVNIKAASLNAQGPVYAGTTLNVQTQGDLSNQQSLAARDSINLSAGGQLTNNGVIEAGVNADSGRNASGDVNLSAQNLNNSGKSVIASRNLTVNTAQTLNNQGGTFSAAQTVNMSAGALDNQNKGRVLSADRLDLNATQVLNGQGGLINSSGALTAKVGHLVNHEGLLSANGTLKLTADTADNDAGTLSSKGDLTADIHILNQQGGMLVSQGNLSLTGNNLDNRNAGLVGGVKGTTLTVDSIDNRGGEFSSTQGVKVASQHLNNSDSGKVLAGTDLKLTVADLLNQTGGQLVGKVGTTISGTRLDNSGGILKAQSALVITLDNALTNQLKGLISSEGTLSVHAGSLDNSGGSLSSAGQLSLTSSSALINQGGRLVTDSGLDLHSASLDNRQKGTISGQSAVLINTGHFDNSHGGFLSSGDSLNLTTAQLTNQDGGRIGAAKALTASVTGLDQQGGQLKGDTSLTLDLNHGQLNNQGGMINAPILVLNNLKGVNNQSGEISSAQALTIAAESLDNGNGKLLSNQALTLRIDQALSSIKGMIAAAAVDVHAGSLDNSGGTLTSRAELGLTIDGQLTNQNLGLINATTALTINSAGLNNQSGSLLGSAIAIDFGSATGDLNNAAGHVVTAGNLSIDHLRDLNNQGGELSSVQSINLTARTLDNSNAGKLISNTLLNLTAGSLINQNGGLFSGWQGLSLNGSSLDNRNNGTVSSRSGNVDVTIGGALLNSGAGALVSQNILTVNAASLDNSNQGVLSSVGGQSLSVSGLLNNAQGGVIGSGATLTLSAMTLGNTGGTVNAQQALSFTGSQINNQGGQLSSQGQMTLLTGGLDNSNHGTVGATDSLKLTATGAVQNTAGGLIASRNADLQLTAASLGNARGSLQGKGAVNLDVAGDIDNQSGKIIAQDGDLTLKAANVDSRGGVLSSVKGALEARVVGVLKNGYDLTNNRQGGTLQAQRLDLQAWGGIDNYGGRIAAQTGDAVIATGAGSFDNRNGGLYAKGQVNVTGNNFDNSGDNDGQIAGNQITLNLNGALNNRLGIIESDTTLAIKAASLDNQTGQLRALGTSGKTDFQIGGLFDNRNGTLESANTDLSLAVGGFLNGGGSLLHVGTGTFDISTANFTGAGGSIVTRGGLTLNADSWTNSSVIQAGRLNVNVNNFSQTASGQLLTSDSFVGTGGNWYNDGLIASDGSLSLNLGGTYRGNGRLSTLGTLGLSAAQIGLSSSASIAGGGDTSISVGGPLTNSGRLTSATNLNLTAGGINNLGTLGSGQQLTVTTGALVNDHGLIFSGGDMQLLSPSFTNSYGQVYSLGNTLIARDKNGTKADLLDNRSGGIDSTGNLTIAATTVNNVMDVLQYTEHEKSVSTITELPCALIAGPACDYRGGGRRNGLWEIAETDRLKVTLHSEAASINSGANLTINAGEVNNISSSLTAAGDLTATASTINNKGLQEQEIESTRRYVSWVNETATAIRLAGVFTKRNNPTPSATVEADMSNFLAWMGEKLPANTRVINGESLDAIIQAGANVTLNAAQNINNSVVRPYYAYVAAGRTKTDTGAGGGYSTPIYINAQLRPDLAQQQVNPIALPGFSLPTGQNGLFRLSGQGSSTVVNTAPQSWTMGGASLGTAQRQLAPGDLSPSSLTVGAVDRSQVTQPISIARVQGMPDTSGKSNPQKYLIETNPVLTDLKQFMSSDYLLANLGYDPDKSAKRLGDGLYEQKLIQQAVVARTGQRFIDGQTSDDALFKYLMNNAVASKQQLNLSLGVSLTSEQVAALTHDIVWMENAEVSGEQVLVPVLYLASANNRLAANGALIQGKDVSLIAGKDLNNAGTLRASNNLSAAAGNDLVNSGLVEAGNRLDLLAGNNLVNKAGGIIAGRDVSLTAIRGDVINERTVTTHESAGDYRGERTDFVDSAARVEAANNLAIRAGRDINDTGGVLKSGADTTISAGRDVNLTSVQQVASNKYGTDGRDQTITQYGSSVDVGRDLKVDTGRDLTAIASQIDAKRDIAMSAVGDLTLASAANEQHSYSHNKKVTSQQDHVQQVSTTLNAGGNVALNAGKDLGLIASRVSAGDEAYLVAGGNLTLQTAEDSDYSFYSKTTKSSSGKKSQLDEVASTTNIASAVTSGGNSVLLAGKDLLIKGSEVAADKGGVQLVAGNDVQIVAVTDSNSARHEKSSSKSSWGGLKSSKMQDQLAETQTKAVGSVISGNTVDVAARRDATITGSSLVSTQDLSVQAGRDLTINAAENTFTRNELHKEKNRDLMGIVTANNLGVDDITGNQHLSVSSQNHTGKSSQTTLTGSTVGSSEGNVSLTSGRELSVIASDLVSTKNMSLIGSKVTIAAGMESANQSSTDKSSSFAVGRVVGGAIVDTVNTIRSAVKAANNADDPRLKAVKLAQAALAVYNLNGMASDANSQSSGFKDKQGGTASNGSLIKIGTELANTHSKSTSEYESQTAKQSTVNAGKDLSIIASGNAVGTLGDIHIVGSSLKAANTLLLAKNDITLESAQNTADWANNATNNKTSIGASFNIGQQNGFTLDLGAQIAKSMGTGSSVTQVNSTLDTGKLLLRSGNDTTLAGAQVRADSIQAQVDGNLNIISRQDSEIQKNQQGSGGFGASICIPPFCYGSTVAASASLAAGNMNSEYKQVTDQSGLFAGKGGYNLDVGKNTTLQGAVIASEASADKNLLSTDRLIVSDIKNVSEIQSQAAGVSVSGSYGGGGASASPGGLYGIALQDSDHSKTRSAVSEGTIIVRNAEGANDLVGLNRDTANANSKLDKPDEKAMQERVELVKSSMELAQGIGDAIAKAKVKEAQDSNSETSKAARQKLFDDGVVDPTSEQVAKQVEQDYGVGSSFQKASQAVTAIVQGLVGGSIGGAVAGAAAPYLAQTVRDMTVGDDTANLMAHAVLGAVIARAGGNSALAGATGAVVAEETARLIRNELYGGISNEELTQEQKQTISTLTTLAAGIAGSVTGKDALNAVAAAQVGKNAVENNQLSPKDVNNLAHELIEANNKGESTEGVWEKYKALSAKQREEMLSTCGGTGGPCTIYYQDEMDGGITAADGLSALTWFFNLSDDDAKRIRQYVTDENQGDMALLYKALPTWEKIALVAKDTAEALGVGGLASRSKTSVAAVVGKSRGSPIPVAEPTTASNGLTYMSNSKHTPGQMGNRANAGIEPQNSLELFGQSINSPITYPNKVVTFARDESGNIHRFEGTNDVYHWNGSTGDAKNPLGANYVPAEVQKALGVKLR